MLKKLKKELPKPKVKGKRGRPATNTGKNYQKVARVHSYTKKEIDTFIMIPIPKKLKPDFQHAFERMEQKMAVDSGNNYKFAQRDFGFRALMTVLYFDQETDKFDPLNDIVSDFAKKKENS
jgi:hypothetical protein